MAVQSGPRFGLSGCEGLGKLDVAVSVLNKARHYQTVAVLTKHDFRHELICSFTCQPVCIVSITVTALLDDKGSQLDQETGQIRLTEEKADQISIQRFSISSIY